MVFSLFENNELDSKVRLKFPSGSNVINSADLGHAFQIGNFMNILYQNIGNECVTMTESVISHILKIEVEALVSHCCNVTEDISIKSCYLFGKEQIIKWIDLIVEELKLKKQLENELPNLKDDIKEQTKRLIESMTRSSYEKYNQLVDEIIWIFEYYLNTLNKLITHLLIIYQYIDYERYSNKNIP